MRTSDAILAEQKLDRIATFALFHQGAWIVSLIILLLIKPYNFKVAGQSLAALALVASFTVSRIYILAGKKVESLKNLSNEEGEQRKKEYFRRFFLPYILWLGCIALFSSL